MLRAILLVVLVLVGVAIVGAPLATAGDRSGEGCVWTSGTSFGYNIPQCRKEVNDFLEDPGVP